MHRGSTLPTVVALAAGVALSLALPLRGTAQPAERAAIAAPGEIPHVASRPKLDGVLDDDVWSHALKVPLTIETGPRENQPALVETTAYLAEDGSALLIAFDARDPDPKSIRAYLRDSDTAYNDDFVGVVLDTFNDQRRAFEFFANPLGVQMDLISDDVNRNESDAWDAIWDSAGQITGQGFVVEMVIPFSQLRFPRAPGGQTWGIDVLRFRPRSDRTRISNNPLDRNRSCYLCQFAKFHGFANAEPGRALEVVPTLTSTRTDTRAAAPSTVLARGAFDSELGVGVRWGITPDITADLALNPDFSQVEADVAQLGENAQFALFYPESRPFFLEGAEYYGSPLEAVFTRTMADPDVGAKLTGRSGQNTFGAFAVRDAVTNLLFPGPLGSQSGALGRANDAFVGRYTRGFGDASTIGALVTDRSADGYHNSVAGFDGRYHINDQNTLRFQRLQSRTEYPADVAATFAQATGELAGSATRLEYYYQTRDWYVNFYHQDLDPGFRADTGFIPRVDYDEDWFKANRTWQGHDGTIWNQLQAGMFWDDAHDSGGRLLGRSAEPFFSFSGPRQSFVQVRAGPRQEYWDGKIFDLDELLLFSQIRPRTGLNMVLQARIGQAVDYSNSAVGRERRVQPQIDWNATRHLLVRLQHTSDVLTRSGAQVFDAELTDLRVTWQFNLRSFVRVTLQRQDIDRNVALYALQTTEPRSQSLGTQLLYAYKLNPQTLLYAGYSDNRLEDLVSGRLEQTGRTLFLKLSYAWTP